MGRPKKHEPRDQQLNLRLTAREYNDVCSRAAAAGLRPGEFGRMQLLSERAVKIMHAKAEIHRDRAMLIEFSRIGNNLNQITRRLHQLDIAVPEALPPLLATIRNFLEISGNSRPGDDC